MSEAPGFRPLYRQVYDYLVKQIVAGQWAPGDALPSEQALAAQLGVSQGTARKALDALTAENLLERRQGKGTYVAEHTQERALFRFFRLAWPDGQRAVPSSTGEVLKRRSATDRERAKLRLPEAAEVHEVVRTRLVDGAPCLFETIVLPVALFPDLEARAPLPNALYQMYQRDYGLNIVSTEEELRADLARRDDVKRLNVALGDPLLHIERVAVALDGARVEWRVSRCDTAKLVYAVTLS
jgi:GntR family transcriptional regulator